MSSSLENWVKEWLISLRKTNLAFVGAIKKNVCSDLDVKSYCRINPSPPMYTQWLIFFLIVYLFCWSVFCRIPKMLCSGPQTILTGRMWTDFFEDETNPVTSTFPEDSFISLDEHWRTILLNCSWLHFRWDCFNLKQCSFHQKDMGNGTKCAERIASDFLPFS